MPMLGTHKMSSESGSFMAQHEAFFDCKSIDKLSKYLIYKKVIVYLRINLTRHTQGAL